MERFDYCIIGSGVIGLAIAYQLSLECTKAKILLIETHHQYGSETSSRNSEVIHAGIYYSPDSLKSTLCRKGNERIYDFCQSYSVPYKRVGKLIVASHPSELTALEKLQKNAFKNGVNLTFLNQKQCKEKEPNINAIAALLSESTGIIDSHSYMQALLTLALQQGVLYSPNTQFLHAKKMRHAYQISLGTSDGEFVIRSNNIINCAGLLAPQVAEKIDNLSTRFVPKYSLCKGHYYSYQGPPPFSHLIYPLPEKNTNGLGIHATLDLSGQVRFGPDTQYINNIDYSFCHHADNTLKEAFTQSIRRYFPDIQKERLHPSYTGIRPKLSSQNETAKDFLIQGKEFHGTDGLVNLFGIESPGLTASLAIASNVANRFK